MNKQNNNQIKGRQSNHGDYYLPACLTHLGRPPLYMAVAYWGLLKKSPFTRDDLSAAFHITVRRAADVMTYIYIERQNCITSKKSLVNIGSGHSCLYLQVLAVAEPAPPRQTFRPPERRTSNAYNKEGQQELWHWLLTRPAGGDPE
ncbi:CaiF/GrlA family transcriptional regulator [Yersinia sp. Marseille-Q3913]|uniref:CaiF/GrlA family transcriptional regulator n=1 Tax=Yersinia sp. Marseille-Q3913 TaxID=2830769 RepID=UPI001BAEFDEC|nr:CaiF/GrlA family transcriptional regulator [Yersinia sp. Marseille-Q3913]